MRTHLRVWLSNGWSQAKWNIIIFSLAVTTLEVCNKRCFICFVTFLTFTQWLPHHAPALLLMMQLSIALWRGNSCMTQSSRLLDLASSAIVRFHRCCQWQDPWPESRYSTIRCWRLDSISFNCFSSISLNFQIANIIKYQHKLLI